MFDDGEFDVCTSVLLRFQSVISQVPTARSSSRLPSRRERPSRPAEASTNTSRTRRDPRRPAAAQHFRPDLSALLENAASEQGARMSAMDNATRNAGEMIDKLTLTYNRQRQAQITKELIEIISGAEAL
jgi:F-type H+-transporting ATPase subunit gamma